MEILSCDSQDAENSDPASTPSVANAVVGQKKKRSRDRHKLFSWAIEGATRR
jgi:hypothetical protein